MKQKKEIINYFFVLLDFLFGVLFGEVSIGEVLGCGRELVVALPLDPPLPPLPLDVCVTGVGETEDEAGGINLLATLPLDFLVAGSGEGGETVMLGVGETEDEAVGTNLLATLKPTVPLDFLVAGGGDGWERVILGVGTLETEISSSKSSSCSSFPCTSAVSSTEISIGDPMELLGAGTL